MTILQLFSVDQGNVTNVLCHEVVDRSWNFKKLTLIDTYHYLTCF